MDPLSALGTARTTEAVRARGVLPWESGMSTAFRSMTSMLPLQILSVRTLGIGEPEKRLLAAVLKDAIQVYQALACRSTPRTRKHLAELEEWFASDDMVYPFAFRRICEALSFDPGWVRAGLARWRASHALGEAVALAS